MIRTASLLLLLLLLPMGLAACDRGEDRAFEDHFPACAFPQGTTSNPFVQPDPATFTAGDPVEIQVSSTGCLSGSCDIDRAATCNVSVDGAAIVVTSNLSWRSTGASSCTEDCGRITATCMTPPLDAGQYELRHGDRKTLLTVGEEQAIPCTPTPE